MMIFPHLLDLNELFHVRSPYEMNEMNHVRVQTMTLFITQIIKIFFLFSIDPLCVIIARIAKVMLDKNIFLFLPLFNLAFNVVIED